MLLGQNENGRIVVAVGVTGGSFGLVRIMVPRPLAWVLSGMIIAPGVQVGVSEAVEVLGFVAVLVQ